MQLDEARVLGVNADFYQAFASGDAARMDELWARAHEVSCIHPGWDVLHGRAEVMQSWRAILRSERTPIEASDARAHVVGDAAYVICLEGMAGQPPTLAATNLFAREGGEWRIVHHQAGPLARPRPPSATRPTN